MKRPDGHGRGGWSRDCGHPGPLRRPGLRFKLKPTATLNATQIARFPAKLPDRETNNLSGASAPPACAHRKSGITAQGERQRKEASTLVSFLPAGVLAPPRSCPRPERGGGAVAAGVWRWRPLPRGAEGTFGRGGTRRGHAHCPVPREATGRPGRQAGGRQAGPRALALGAPSAGTCLPSISRSVPRKPGVGHRYRSPGPSLQPLFPGRRGQWGQWGPRGQRPPPRLLAAAKYPRPGSPRLAHQELKRETLHERLRRWRCRHSGTGNAAGPRAS